MRLRVIVCALMLLVSARPADAASALSGWLAPEDALERCPVIVILNGDHPARAEEGARLYHAGGAPRIWLTRDPRSGSGAGDDAGTESNLARLVARRVPLAAITILTEPVLGTRAELEVVAAELRRQRFPCALIVTSPLHARRVRLTWQRAVGDSPRAVIRHARDAAYAGWRVEMRELGLSLLALLGVTR